MITSQLNTYQIADFLEWHRNKQLVLNPGFQRRSVWTHPAKVFLIDTILRELSLPKFYIRTKIDLDTKHSMREVVDGQQRLTAIIDFANDGFTLTARAAEFEGYKYSTLSSDLQEKFLQYTLAVEHLVNASDTDVLEVFSRLNSYGETLNAAEKRHAQFQGEFKWLVHNTAQRHSSLWEKYKIIGLQQRLRMADDSTVAELYGILLEGVKDGGEPHLNKLYVKYDEQVPKVESLLSRMDKVLDLLESQYADVLRGPLGKKAQFIILFAAVAYSVVGFEGIDQQSMFETRRKLKSRDEASSALARISEALEVEDDTKLPDDLRKFRSAAKSSTQRLKSRQTRFHILYNALTES